MLVTCWNDSILDIASQIKDIMKIEIHLLAFYFKMYLLENFKVCIWLKCVPRGIFLLDGTGLTLNN